MLYHSEFAVVTGAAKRIGALIAKSFANKGVSLVLHYHKSKLEIFDLKNSLEREYPNIKIFLIQANLAFSSKIFLKKLNFLINNFSVNIKFFVHNASIFQADNYVDEIQVYIKILQNNLKIHVEFPIIIAKFLQDLDRKIIFINMCDKFRSDNCMNINKFGKYFLYSMSKHMQYMASNYIKKNFTDSNQINIAMIDIMLGYVLYSGNIDQNHRELFLKKGIDEQKIKEKLKLIEDLFNTIIENKENSLRETYVID